TEWRPHSLTMPEDREGMSVQVYDSWSDVPENLLSTASVFSKGIFSYSGNTRVSGVAVPVFSLRSRKSFGVGEFADIRLLVDWAAKTGQKVIQFLPVNDTTMSRTRDDSYPYNANSSFALHPQFIRLTDAGVEEDAGYLSLQQELNSLPDLDYERVNREKERLLREVFSRDGEKVTASEGFRRFFASNRSWLLPYAAYS
ncbi:Glycoside hydrolase, family 77, partial [gut metagenome]